MYYYNKEKIKEIRCVKGLSREDLASGAGVTVTTIWNIEGGSCPQLKSLIKIVNFLKVKIDDVIEFDSEHKEDEQTGALINSSNDYPKTEG